jgi:hypothetical protein
MLFSAALLALLPAVLAAPAAEPAAAAAAQLDKRAPIIAARAGQVVPGKYIIKLKAGADDKALERAVGKLGKDKAEHVYKSRKFKGFAGKIDAPLLEELRNLPEVSSS